MALDTTIGGAASDSYVTLAEWEAYATAQGWALGATEANLRRAALSIDVSNSFIGQSQYQAQSRQWPRIWTGLVDGWPINPDTIPTAVKQAQMELAYLIHAGADPLATVEGVIGSERVKAGPVESDITYIGGKASPRYTAVSRLLRPYLTAGEGQLKLVRG